MCAPVYGWLKCSRIGKCVAKTIWPVERAFIAFWSLADCELAAASCCKKPDKTPDIAILSALMRQLSLNCQTKLA